MREIAQAIGRRLDKPDLIALGAQPYAPQDPMRVVADITKLQTETGWRPRFDLDAGLAKTIEYWKLQR